MGKKKSLARIVSDNVKLLRKEDKLSVVQLAKKTGISVRYLHEIECRAPQITLGKLELLAKAFGVDAASMLEPSSWL